MCFILHSDRPLLLLVNIQGSFHCKQGMSLVNIQGSLHCKQGMLLVNIQGNIGNIILQLPVVYKTESTTSSHPPLVTIKTRVYTL